MKRKFYLILALLAVALNLGLGSWGLTESSEARYAEISREMVNSGNYLQPKLLGIYHFDKPPLTYYITALGYKLFGVNEFGARFFLGVALWFQILLVFKIGLLLFKNEKTAFASALIYLSFPIVLAAARNLTTDCYLATFVLWAIYLWLQRKQGRHILFLYGFYAVLGLGFLTKGPVVLLPVLTFIGTWKIIYREPLRFTVHSILGALLCMAVSSSWFVTVIVQKPELWDYFVVKQVFERAIAAKTFHRAKPVWYYLAFAPLVGLPWLFFIVFKGVKNFKSLFKAHRLTVILGGTFLFLLIVFSLFSSKLILYIFPLYGFLALLGGNLMTQFSKKEVKAFTGIFIGLFVLLGVGTVVFALLNPVQFNWYAGIALFLFTVGSAVYVFDYAGFTPKNRLLYGGVALSLAVLFFFTAFASQNPYKINSTKDLAHFVQQGKGGKINRVITYNYLLPSLSFYLKKPLLSINAGYYKAVQDIQFQETDAYKSRYLNVKNESGKLRFKTILKQPGNVLVIKQHDLFNKTGKRLLKHFQHKKKLGKWLVYF